MSKTLEGATWDYENHTPHDTNEITRNGNLLRNPIKGLIPNVEGDVVTVNSNGNDVTHYGLIPGIIYPIRTRIIKDTGTTATSFTVYYHTD